VLRARDTTTGTVQYSIVLVLYCASLVEHNTNSPLENHFPHPHGTVLVHITWTSEWINVVLCMTELGWVYLFLTRPAGYKGWWSGLKVEI